jgi:hypothetical protein
MACFKVKFAFACNTNKGLKNLEGKVDSFRLGTRQVARFCKYCNEPSGSTHRVIFILKYYFVQKISVPRCLLMYLVGQ